MLMLLLLLPLLLLLLLMLSKRCACMCLQLLLARITRTVHLTRESDAGGRRGRQRETDALVDASCGR